MADPQPIDLIDQDLRVRYLDAFDAYVKAHQRYAPPEITGPLYEVATALEKEQDAAVKKVAAKLKSEKDRAKAKAAHA